MHGIHNILNNVSPVRPLLSLWDLNLALLVLQKTPFKNRKDILLLTPSQKVQFIDDIAFSGKVHKFTVFFLKPPFLILHKDKVILNVSAFHLYEGIMFLSFCPKPVHPMEVASHSLKVVKGIWMELNASCFRSYSLFNVVEGPNKALAVLIATILHKAIVQAYAIKH